MVRPYHHTTSKQMSICKLLYDPWTLWTQALRMMFAFVGLQNWKGRPQCVYGAPRFLPVTTSYLWMMMQCRWQMPHERRPNKCGDHGATINSRKAIATWSFSLPENASTKSDIHFCRITELGGYTTISVWGSTTSDTHYLQILPKTTAPKTTAKELPIQPTTLK